MKTIKELDNTKHKFTTCCEQAQANILKDVLGLIDEIEYEDYDTMGDLKVSKVVDVDELKKRIEG